MFGRNVLSGVFCVLFFQESVVCLYELRFGAGSSNISGPIEVLRDGRLLPVCIGGMDYGREAILFCRLMGFVGGFPLYIPNGQNLTMAFVVIECTNQWAESISECDIIEHPYTGDCGVFTIGVSCFNTTGARLIGTTQPNIGRLQVEYNEIWVDVCFLGGAQSDRTWNYDNLKVLCRQLGYPSYMLSKNVAYQFSPQATFIDDYKCLGDEMLLQDCLPDPLSDTTCSENLGVLASCAAPGYIGCILDVDPVDRLLPDYENEDDEHPWFSDDEMTIQKCIETCRRFDTAFAGVQQMRCFCGASDKYDGIISARVDDSECTYDCLGNHYEICGGANELSVYSITAAYCQDPGHPVNGRHNSTAFPFGGIVSFQCFLGYKLSGLSSIQCVVRPGSNGPVWSGPVPECEVQPTETTYAQTRLQSTANGSGPKGLAGNDSDFPIGIVAGAVGGGLVVLAILIAMLFFVTRKKKQPPGKSHETDVDHSNLNRKSPSTVRYSNVPDERLNDNAVKISTLTRKDDNFIGDKTHAYEQTPPQDVYDYAELPQETYEEVAQTEYSDIAPEEQYADVSHKDYSEIAINGTMNQDSTDTSSNTPLGSKKPSFPPYAKIDKDQKNKRQSEHLYNYAELEAPGSENANEEYADVEIPMLDGKNDENTGNTSEKADSEEGWAECIIYDDYDDDNAVVPAANQGKQEQKNGWVENDIYNT